MLSVVFAAVAVQAVDPPSLISWSDLAREVKETGQVTCELSTREQKLRAKPINTPELFPSDFPSRGVSRYPGCAVLRLKIDASGRVTDVSVLRQKGQRAPFFREIVGKRLKFAPGKSDRVAFLSVLTKVPADEVAEVLTDLDRPIAEEQAAGFRTGAK